MGPFVKAGVLLVLYLKRERKKRKEERSRGYVLGSMPGLFEIACSCKLAESAPHLLVEGYNHITPAVYSREEAHQILARC